MHTELLSNDMPTVDGKTMCVNCRPWFTSNYSNMTYSTINHFFYEL